jgi:hypothetical protein
MRRLLTVTLLAVMLTTGSLAEKTSTAELYGVYMATREIAQEMFFEYSKQNLHVMRHAATLDACGQTVLARALETKNLKDANLTQLVESYITQGHFNNLPEYSALAAQNAASALVRGYHLGFIQALRPIVHSIKPDLCEGAIRTANEQLK